MVLLSACGARTSSPPIGSTKEDTADSDSDTGGISSFSGFTCEDAPVQQFDETNMRPYSVPADVEQRVADALSRMSTEAKTRQMYGVPVANKNYRDVHRSQDVEVPGLGTVRGFHYRDGVRGVNLEQGQDNRPDHGENIATAFPAPSLRGASWDIELERRVGEAIGDETAASLNNVLVAPGVNLLRHPYWGRSQESYGEDTYLVGRMGAAMTVGVQEHVVACAKTFAAYGLEKHRGTHNVSATQQTLREVLGRQFEMVIQDGGVGCVMAAYNLVNGVKMTQHEPLLRKVLKAPVEEGGMGFRGFVLSDWWATPSDQTPPDAETAQSLANEALRAGLDVEVPWGLQYSDVTLTQADPSLVEDSARRVLTQKFRLGTALESDPWSAATVTSRLDGDSIAPNETHEALAEEVALESMVLLDNGARENGAVLPFEEVKSVAVLGPKQFFRQISSSVPPSCKDEPDQTGPRECAFDFARYPAVGDRGWARVNFDPSRSFGPFDGIRNVAPAGVAVTAGNEPAAGAEADVVVVVVGYTPEDEGEEYYIADGGDRDSLDLPEGHVEFVEQVLSLGKPTVIVVETGSVVNLPWLSNENQKQATVWAGYSGQLGGRALGRLLFGQANFSGKLPFSWPAEQELRSFKDSDSESTAHYLFGYRDYDHRKYVEGLEVDLVYPFGHGLSYASFRYSNLVVPCTTMAREAVFQVTVDIENHSQADGDEVALLFIKPPPRPPGLQGERPHKQLLSFAKVFVPAGETATVHLPVRIQDLRRWEGGTDGRWVIDPGQYTVVVAPNAEAAETSPLSATFVVAED